ncbi:MAG: lipoyl synthase [Candidatus Heimdallarchaeota archaeon]|nr:MAG: lipoyl synthase [Candidatus Heimdallarchaeota archaeon]
MKKTPKPKWIRAKLPTKREFGEIKSILRDQNLHTVCEEAFCPNRAECWESRTATFLLMGSYCTRRCKFCDVETRNPHQYLSSSEPENLADAVRKLGLKYVVLTSVTRDDLADGGAEHLSSCIRNVRQKNPGVLIEILIPDFRGNMDSLKKLVDCKPEVIGHNIETTEDLTPIVRDKKSSFKQSIDVLKNIKQLNSRILTKSSMMLGLGETDAQVLAALHHLKRVKVDIVTLGQYLQPSRKHLEVVEYLDPQKFEYWDGVAQKIGFLYVASGPLVRSSYRAGEMYVQNFLKTN